MDASPVNPIQARRFSGRSTAHGAAQEVRDCLTSENRQSAMRAGWQLAGDLTAVPRDRVPSLTADAPDLTGDPRFDALLAAIVDHVLTTARLPVPGWVSEDARTLTSPWDAEPVAALREAARAVTPVAIRRHGIWLDPDELINV